MMARTKLKHIVMILALAIIVIRLVTFCARRPVLRPPVEVLVANYRAACR